jgi:hypothetical protein
MASTLITTNVISDNAITTAKIVDANVTTAKILDGAITTAKFATGAIGTASVADNSINITKLAVSDGSAGQSLTTNGSGTLAFATIGGAYNDFLIKTGNYTALNKDQLIVNSGSAVTITLPSSPSAGNIVYVKNVGAGTVTIARNSSKINSLTEDGTLTSTKRAQLVYVDATIGWTEL